MICAPLPHLSVRFLSDQQNIKTTELAEEVELRIKVTERKNADIIPLEAGTPRQTNKKMRKKCIAYWCSDDISAPTERKLHLDAYYNDYNA